MKGWYVPCGRSSGPVRLLPYPVVGLESGFESGLDSGREDADDLSLDLEVLDRFCGGAGSSVAVTSA